jgi:succinate dehydrogenase hydrophobic anchor subunit
MVAIGSFMLLGGGCFAACGFILPGAQLPPEQAEQLQKIEAQFHGNFTAIFVAVGIIFAANGIYHIVMGFIVRRGARGAIYAAIVSSFLALGWFAINTLGAAATGSADMASGLCFMIAVGSIFVWLLVWLFAALRGTTSPAAVAQYQAQYWQSLQNQQSFGPPVPPPNVLTPPPPPSPDPKGWAYENQVPPPPSPPPPPPPAPPA